MLRRLICLLLPCLFMDPWAVAEGPALSPPAGPARADRLLSPPPSPVPLPADALRSAIRDGVKYLLQNQDPDGSWGSPRWTGGVDSDPVPGAFHSFDVAVTALCLQALLGAGDSPEVDTHMKRAEAFLWENLPKLRRAGPGDLPNIWGHCYGIQVLVQSRRRSSPDSDRQGRLEEMIRGQIEALKRFETSQGGWFYYASGMQRPRAPSASFVNAAVLVALSEAKRIGIEADPQVLKRAIWSTAAQRKPDSSYLYSMFTPTGMAGAMRPINRPAGSLGRSQACNLALRLWGDERISDQVLRNWLNRLITRNGWLDMGRKRPIPHQSHAAVAGYFFYFGHYYAALCIHQLPEIERPFYQDHLAHLLINLQEKDGSWFDYPLYSYHKPYGTAFALMSLEHYRRTPSGGVRPQ